EDSLGVVEATQPGIGDTQCTPAVVVIRFKSDCVTILRCGLIQHPPVPVYAGQVVMTPVVSRVYFDQEFVLLDGPGQLSRYVLVVQCGDDVLLPVSETGPQLVGFADVLGTRADFPEISIQRTQIAVGSRKIG